ncbi:PilZ domain-containing protein [Novosphingobium sp. PhB165]|uniref:PilZ domain-containing protein n=1 Tax=Novosphingobium sp. PhB165 TaxID=2485105 RepID=UPI0010D3DFBA|nr:PilZ domain-containing protein [Novosphingobium sp. PhB165]TCM17866.1 PilZ domain-containing protein [Novosphingobium sp. PhB165]
MSNGPSGSERPSMAAQGADHGRRGRSRLRVRLTARVITRTQTKPAVLADLSLTGARIATEAELKPGAEVVLEWGRFEAFGEVVWCRGQYCGIAFFDMIPTATLIATRDLDDKAHLPADRDLVREVAQSWVRGKTRL